MKREITAQVGRHPVTGMWHAELIIPDGKGNMRSQAFETESEAILERDRAVATAAKHFTNSGFICELSPETGTIQ